MKTASTEAHKQNSTNKKMILFLQPMAIM